MNLEIGNTLYGFTVKNIRPVLNKDAQLIEFVYEKTGTEVCWYKSKEENKLFSIGFKTLPQDDTGVFHILEHSVLCGSSKYPVKEPFVELLKSSMNTFLNAMTFPDKTIYPVSSRNEQDFINLTSVYLDAVFNPNILHNEHIFEQEGWHFEKRDETLFFNGVVFNEMKGAFSSVDTIISSALQKMLFPDTCYGYVSGGHPEAIPDLTYQQFVDTYKSFYHPSNARVYLDGSVPLERVLKLIESYLSSYEKGLKHEIVEQMPKVSKNTIYYEESDDNKAQYVCGKIVNRFEDKTKLLAMHVLCDVLSGSNDAPLKKAILDHELGEDVSLYINDGVYQPWMQLRVHNTHESKFEKIEETIKNTIQSLMNTGLDKKQLHASINQLAFHLKEMREPQGLMRGINALESWLYNGDPMLYLSYDEAIEEVREMVESNAFTSLLEELFKDNTLSILHVLPSATYGEDVRNKEKERLSIIYKQMSEEDKKEVDTKYEIFSAWQHKEDSKEDLATLPVLDVKEISPLPIADHTTIKDDGIKVLHHFEETNGIIHIAAYFTLADTSLEDLTKLSMLCDLLGELPTKNYDALTLQSEIKTYIGSLYFDIETFADIEDPTKCTPTLCVNASVLKENVEHAERIILEILNNTDFSQKSRIETIAKQNEMEEKQNIITRGHTFSVQCAQAQFSAQAAVNEALNAYTFYKWLTSFNKDFASQIDEIINLYETTLHKVIKRNRLTLSICEDGNYDYTSFVNAFTNSDEVIQANTYKTALPKKMAIQIPAQVSYVGCATHLQNSNTSYHGALRVLSTIVSYDYLWNKVRVQGGAYGAGMGCGRNGNIYTYSFRDPSPAKTIDVVRNISSFTKDFVKQNDSVDKFIISTIGESEPLQSARQKQKSADARYFSNLTYEMRKKEREEILKTTPSTLLQCTSAIDNLKMNPSICVIGYEDALKACEKEELEKFTL